MDLERVIELLNIEYQCVLRNHRETCDRNCVDCDLVQEDSELLEMYRNAIYTLERQKPKTVTRIEYNGSWYFQCPNCDRGEDLLIGWSYCPYCGQAVKWDD